ncbi:helix-turn-helix domain-containing protein [Algicola sagamiensis]|uniref:helix-turn-helix domain-containing protein n=1 Tax=Algicola sagamiensis TaxID=163869 RepID=UPI00036B69C8|nr:DNA-binding transcriptional regulator [Algicola sagamiensis]
MDKSILEVVHESVQDMHDVGVVDTVTMRQFDKLCLPKTPALDANEIKAIRVSTKASQSVFAAYLNTSLSTIQKWEQGIKKPNGPSLKLLHLVKQHGLQILK